MANNEAPYEQVAGPATIYLAAEGTTMPVVDAAPSGSWTLLGTNGARNYDESGVAFKMAQTIKKQFSLGSTLPTKAWRSQEDFSVKVKVIDITLEQLKLALNGNDITTVAASSGVAGYKSISLERGFTVKRYALLLRFYSPYGDFTAQIQIPCVSQVGEPELVHVKDAAIAHELTFDAFKHASQSITAVFGTAPAL